MKTRFALCATLVLLSPAAAHAGSLENGVWTPKCTAPPPAPEISSESATAYNETGKAMLAWQTTAKAYVDCLSNEAKADQSAIVSAANASVNALSAQINALNQTETDLEAGDIVKVRMDVPRQNSVDIYCSAQSARLAGVGESPF